MAAILHLGIYTKAVRIFQLIAIWITKKAISLCVVGASTLSVLSISTVDGGMSTIHPLPKQIQIEKDIVDYANLPMHEGVNSYIEVEGWDRLTYKVTISINFFRTVKGSYEIKSPEFFMIQQKTGMAISYSSLNMVDSNNQTVRYTCSAVKSNKDSTFVNFVFNRYSGKPAAENNEKTESAFIQFTSPDGGRWKAYVDSTFTPINDTSALLKFNLVKT